MRSLRRLPLKFSCCHHRFLNRLSMRQRKRCLRICQCYRDWSYENIYSFCLIALARLPLTSGENSCSGSHRAAPIPTRPKKAMAILTISLNIMVQQNLLKFVIEIFILFTLISTWSVVKLSWKNSWDDILKLLFMNRNI